MHTLYKSLPLVRRYFSVLQLKYLHYRKPLSVACINKSVSSLLHRRDYKLSSRLYSIDNSDESHYEEDDISDLLEYDDTMQQTTVRQLLHPNSKDPEIIKLNDCASVQDVFDYIQANSTTMDCKHIAQAVLVLWDLQKMFCDYHTKVDLNIKMQQYLSQLISHPSFQQLLELIKLNCSKFDEESLSCMLLYLHKIGLKLSHSTLEMIINRLTTENVEALSLSALSKIAVVVYSETNLKYIYQLQGAISILLEKLETCKSLEDLKLITICFNHMYHLITPEILTSYEAKIQEFIESNVITTEDCRTVLKIAVFLSHPQWSSNHVTSTSKLMFLLKDKLHTLNAFDLFLAYDVLFKNHEPGELLTELHRCASKLLIQLDEEIDFPLELRLKLLACMVCFSSPRHRPDYENVIKNFINIPLTQSAIFDFLKILLFLKPNANLCDSFWNNVMNSMDTLNIEKKINKMWFMLQLSQKYLNFNSDIQYRHKKFENYMTAYLWNEMENGMLGVIPLRFSMGAAFLLAYGNDRKMIEHCVQKITKHCKHLNYTHCLYISKGLRTVIDNTKNRYVTNDDLIAIKTALNKSISQAHSSDKTSNRKIMFLVKTCVYSGCSHRGLINKLLMRFKCDEKLSTNLIRNTIFNLQSTSSLIPDIINCMADYVIRYKDHLLGFNAEKVAYLCYYLGYAPERAEELFQNVADIIIRDQERISGLSYIQVALSLCFFNKLPESFIKHIFNVSFLERLDSELATCYFKDTYPVRVRHNVMQLNRAVCLDYSHANVPWFHQKYIDQLQDKFLKNSNKTRPSSDKIGHYFLQLVDNPEYLCQNEYTPYGYYVDYLIHLDSKGQLTKPSKDENGTRLAILIMKPTAYTTINVQLKGQYQLKKRHLEILGYKVLIVDLAKWNSLVYGETKAEYLSKLIWPDVDNKEINSVVQR